MSWKATRNSLVAIAALACLLPVGAQADWDTHAPEAAFVWRGKPIDPRCVETLVDPIDGPKRVDLVACTKEAADKGPVTRTTNGGFETSDSAGFQSHNDYIYRVLARRVDVFVVETDINTGGSGWFGGVSLLRLSKTDLASVKSFGGGDRCNGGLHASSVEGHLLHWSENNTPPDLLKLGGYASMVPYQDLESSAMSCVALRNIEYDLDTGARRLVSETLVGPLEDRSNWTEQYAFQHCFNVYFNKVLTGGKAVLIPDQIKVFANGFAQACKKS